MKLLGGLSLLGLLVVMGVVLLGQVETAERALAPAKSLAPGQAQGDTPDLSPVQSGQNAVSSVAVVGLVKTLELDYLSAGGQMSEKDMLESLRNAAPELGLEVLVEPPSEASKASSGGYVVFEHVGPTRVAICSRATGNWGCVAEDLRTRKRAEAWAGSLEAASKKAAAGLD